jgi:hypothetical protein
MPTLDERLFRERAGLEPVEALKWWEQYILSGEAAAAIQAGWSLDDVVRARELSLPVNEAIQFGERTQLDPTEVVRWWQAGVRADEAAEALSSGWSLDEAVQRHPAVVERLERTKLQRQEADERRARSEAESRRLAEELRVREEAEYAQRQRRRSAVDGLDLHVDAGASTARFSIAVSDPTFWATEIYRGTRRELGESDSLEHCLALVAERVTQIGGTISEVTCTRVGPEALLAASDGIAHLCARQVTFRLEHGDHRPPPWVRLAVGDESDDIYDDDEDGFYLGDDHGRFGDRGQLLVARRVSVNGTVMLMPALPEGWPGLHRHSESVVSLGRLFLIGHATGEEWELVGRFDDSDEGVAAAEQLLISRDTS